MIDFPSLLFFLLCGAALVALLRVRFGPVFKKRPKSNDTSNAVPPIGPQAPPPTAPPAPAGGQTNKGGGFLGFSLNLLILGLVCLVLWLLGTLAYRYIGLGEAPALRTQGPGFVVPSMGPSSREQPLQSTWVTTNAPGTGWLVISALPGHTLSHCDLATSLALCAAADPVGYRAKCTDENGLEHLWPEPCTKTRFMSFQSKTSSPAPIRLKDNAP